MIELEMIAYQCDRTRNSHVLQHRARCLLIITDADQKLDPRVFLMTGWILLWRTAKKFKRFFWPKTFAAGFTARPKNRNRFFYFVASFQNGEKCIKWPQNISNGHKINIPNGHKMVYIPYEMVIKYFKWPENLSNDRKIYQKVIKYKKNG
jgi:hypothetical protein